MERKTMGSLIAALRKAKGMTQKDLAERLNVSDKSVSRWERDDGAPDLSLIPVIAEIFGITCDELLRGECKSEEDKAFEAARRMEKLGTDTEKDSLYTTESIPEKLSAKGAKECERLLQSKLFFHRICSLISCSIGVIGLIVFKIFEVAHVGYRVGFWAAQIFYLSGVILQIISLCVVFAAVPGKTLLSSTGLSQEAVERLKGSVIRLSFWIFGVLAGLFGYTLPMIIFDVFGYSVVSEYGFLYAAMVLMLYCVIVYFVHGAMLKHGVYQMPEKEEAVYRKNHKLKARLTLLAVGLLVVTCILQNVVTCGGDADAYARFHGFGKEFNDYDSFKEYMEQNVSYEPEYLTSSKVEIAVEYALGMEQKEEETPGSLFKSRLTDHEGNVLCEYYHKNRKVANVSYTEKDGNIFPITTITYPDRDLAIAQIDMLQKIFAVLYVLECVSMFVVYFLKREKLCVRKLQ